MPATSHPRISISPLPSPNGRHRARIIVGVDPGLHKTGYAALEANGLRPLIREAGVLVTNERAEFTERLRHLHRDAQALFRDLRPDVVFLEDLFVHQRFPRTAILLGHARAAIVLAAAAADVRVVTLTPSAVKQAVAGSGRAAKGQVQLAVSRLLGVRRLSDPHAADALALAYAGLSRLGGRAGAGRG
jgi:crossover junction endodeoxyribonuclease RuvC